MKDALLATLTDVGETLVRSNAALGGLGTVDGGSLLHAGKLLGGSGLDVGVGGGKNASAGGMGAKVSPSCVLVVQNGAVKLVNIKNQDTVNQ